MTARRAPIGRLLDLAVALPSCSLVAAGRAVPLVARMGTLGTARVIERVSTAVHDRRVSQATPVYGVHAGAPVLAGAAAVAVSGRGDADTAVVEVPVVDRAQLPIDGYDDLAARQVVDRLDSLSTTDLAVIDAYERTHRGRRTVLGKISMLTS